jgi:hypothetical protein
MWRNPNHPAPPAQAPPQENGRRLATFPRGAGVEMRVNLAEYQGKPFISLRLWERNQSGEWWPVKGKGCSIRICEAGDLAEALNAVASGGAANAHPSPRDDTPKFVDRGRPVRAPWDAEKLAGPKPAERFDEFAGAG